MSSRQIALDAVTTDQKLCLPAVFMFVKMQKSSLEVHSPDMGKGYV